MQQTKLFFLRRFVFISGSAATDVMANPCSTSRRAHGDDALLDEVVRVLSDGEEEVARDVVHVMVCEADLEMNIADGDSLQDVARLQGSRCHRG